MEKTLLFFGVWNADIVLRVESLKKSGGMVENLKLIKANINNEI
jgi:hypothetical protein